MSECQASNIPKYTCAVGGDRVALSDEEIYCNVEAFLDAIANPRISDNDDKSDREEAIFKVLIIPPDYTRYHSYAGVITQMICSYFSSKSHSSMTNNVQITILPALGTHVPMTDWQIRSMYGEELATMQPSPFVVHDWRKDVVTIGHAPKEMVCMSQ